MKDINIVLVEPEIPGNTGNVARTCSACSLALHLVRPLGFTIDSAKMKRAGLDYWDTLDITYYNDLDDFLRKTKDENLVFFSSKGQKVYTDIIYPQRVFLVFGKETKGLPETLLRDNYDKTVRLPMSENQRCLNLSNSVAVGAFEVLRQRNFEGMNTIGHLKEE